MVICTVPNFPCESPATFFHQDNNQCWSLGCVCGTHTHISSLKFSWVKSPNCLFLIEEWRVLKRVLLFSFWEKIFKKNMSLHAPMEHDLGKQVGLWKLMRRDTRVWKTNKRQDVPYSEVHLRVLPWGQYMGNYDLHTKKMKLKKRPGSKYKWNSAKWCSGTSEPHILKAVLYYLREKAGNFEEICSLFLELYD